MSETLKKGIKLSEPPPNLKKDKKKFSMPHSYVILFTILLFAVLLTYLIPAGEYARVEDTTTGKMVAIADSFQLTGEENPTKFFDIFVNIQKGFVSVSDIIFFIIFAYGFVYMLTENGTLNGAIGALVRKMGKRIDLIIPVSMVVFGILGATAGLYEEVYGLLPVFIGISIALGYDALVGGAIVFVGVATGFAAAIINPFTLGIAQGIAGVPLFSGAMYRVLVFIVFQAAAISYVMWYAKTIKKDPLKSYAYGLKIDFIKDIDHDELVNSPFTIRHKICLGLFGFTIALLLYGTTKFGWYIDELAGLFLLMTIITGVVGGYSFNKIAITFAEGAKSVVTGILAAGFSRAILITIKSAGIIDTIVHFLASLLGNTSTYFSAISMLAIQNVINFFIPGGSSQATITMPIMAPLSDLIGLNKQITVLAFQFGDGFSNMFWPTSVALICGLMGIPMNKWYKFMGPLFGIMMVLQVIMMLIAVMINYS